MSNQDEHTEFGYLEEDYRRLFKAHDSLWEINLRRYRPNEEFRAKVHQSRQLLGELISMLQDGLEPS